MNSTEYLPKVITNLSRYFLPIVAGIGTFTSLLSLLVFSQRSMRKNSSGLYFFSFSLSNLIFINISIDTTTLFFGYNIDPTGGILFICQLEFYIGYVTSLLSSIFLVLASIDRFIMTSSSYNIQQLNTRSLAVKLIVILTFVSCLIHIHAFFFIIQSGNSNNICSCRLKTNEYILVISWYILLIFGLLAPVLMIFFGTRTILNIRRVLINSPDRLHSVDRQLILIMLSQCLIHVIFRLPLPIYLLYNYLSKHLMKNSRYSPSNIVFYFIALICFYVPFCTAFFINLISHSFRVELKRLIRRVLGRRNQSDRRVNQRRRQLRVHPINGIIPQINPVQIAGQ